MRSGTALGGQRVVGVDVARGLALLGVMATHVFDTFNRDGTPTAATVIAGGRSAATFVVVAGVSLGFLSGGRTVVHGARRAAAAAGIAVRAVVIGVIGLLLGFAELEDISVILPYYALMFLLAIPMLGFTPLVLAIVAAVVIALGPVSLIATTRIDLPSANPNVDPTLATLVQDPSGLVAQLLVTGSYPVVVYLAFLCSGLAIGRLDLSARRLAWLLLGAGLALAVTARAVSAVLLYKFGGLAQLLARREHSSAGRATERLLWAPEHGTSWWYLALPSPHANTPVDLMHTLGSAIAVLGAALLLTRLRPVRRILKPVAVAGTMSLTLYSAHLLVLATEVLDRHNMMLYLLLIAASLFFAVLWSRWLGQGPLERALSAAANRARDTVLATINGSAQAKAAAKRPSTGPDPR